MNRQTYSSDAGFSYYTPTHFSGDIFGNARNEITACHSLTRNQKQKVLNKFIFGAFDYLNLKVLVRGAIQRSPCIENE